MYVQKLLEMLLSKAELAEDEETTCRRQYIVCFPPVSPQLTGKELYLF